MAHVLMTTRSAVSSDDASSQPARNRRPAISSESLRFIWQPSVQMWKGGSVRASGTYSTRRSSRGASGDRGMVAPPAGRPTSRTSRTGSARLVDRRSVTVGPWYDARARYPRIMDLLTNPEAWAALLTLTTLEIVLGIDNVIFISVLVQRLPMEQRDRARQIGLGLAMIMRIALLLTINWLQGLTATIITIAGHELSWYDIILIVGGLFLLWKATTEIGEALEGEPAHSTPEAGQLKGAITMRSVLTQIVLLDIVFSLDSVLTAVGMADDVIIMIVAVIIAVGVMLVASGPLAKFVHEHPSVKM